jgi:hypothetical protein
MPPLFEAMARKWSNQNLPGALHYVTGNVRDRIPVFKCEDCCQAFLKVFSDLLLERLLIKERGHAPFPTLRLPNLNQP